MPVEKSVEAWNEIKIFVMGDGPFGSLLIVMFLDGMLTNYLGADRSDYLKTRIEKEYLSCRNFFLQ